MASSTEPRGGSVLAGRCFDLQSADWCCNLQSAYQTAFGLYPLLFYKETAFCFGCLFWLYQGRIPRHTCRFYCCLAAHQRTRKKDSAEPSFPILWTPPHPPGEIRCGGAYLLPRAYRDIVSLFPVQTVHPHFDVVFGCFVFGLGSLAFQKITLGICLSFFIIGWKKDAVRVAW